MNRRTGIALAAAGLGMLGIVVGAGAGQRRQMPNAPASKVFKNIRVLKTVPANQIIPLMRKVSASLGVGCDFCHALTQGANGRPEGFERDTKPQKRVARQMITMTSQIDARYRVVDNKVTCFTCHHGHEIPESEVPASERTPRAEPERR